VSGEWGEKRGARVGQVDKKVRDKGEGKAVCG